MQCQICQKETAAFQDEKTGITYHRCTSCEYVFKDPSCYQPIEEQKARYDLHENNEEDEGYRAYFQRFVDFVLSLVGKPQNALDFGCGRSTLLANILKNMNIDTDVYDPIYHPDTLWHTKKYELIVSTEVFEHLHDPKSVFETLVERLEEGGYLALQTQFHPNDIEAFKKWYYHKDPTHIVFFRPRTFEVLAEMYKCELLADNGRNMVVLRKRKCSYMFELLKKLFGKGTQEQEQENEAPGRTFKRILTGDYFGLRNPDATPEMVQAAKQDKVDQIRALGLEPKFLRYARKRRVDSDEEEIVAVHVAFQKEEFDPKLNMVHVTEISFIVPKEEFSEFEQMAGVSLQEDFRDLYESEQAYKGEERRKTPRPSPLERLEED